MNRKPIYLDYNATTPVDPRVAEQMLPYLTEHFGNPSSTHPYGLITKKAVEKARRQVADLLECHLDEIIFTSGGSESNNLALKGAAFARRERGNHIITSAVEHPAVNEVCYFLAQNGFEITYLPVDSTGLVDGDAALEAITDRTILISIMHANNEVGTIQPVGEIARAARQRGILMHSDCAQSMGKIPVVVDDLQVDMLSIAGHKMYAPKGIGALYIRRGVELVKQTHGADHERNWRAGTENVLEIVGLGAACELATGDLEDHQRHLEKVRDLLENRLAESIPEMKINGNLHRRLPNTANVSFPGLEANTILDALTGVAASAGAACHSEEVELSPVLVAMSLPLEVAMGTVRFSVGRFTTEADVEDAAREIISIVRQLGPQTVAPSPQKISADEVKLTQFTHGLGCACKLRPQLLEQVLQKIPQPTDPDILVGSDTSDDAAVYRLNAELAVVGTVDFFTPIVDDPFDFGRIAAVNSLSDVYAMGGTPLFALNVVGFPSNRLPISVLDKILQGALQVANEAGISIIGGHTVDDTEPKFGWAVTGIVHPKSIVHNQGARPGDALILTKALGTGVLATALKRGLLNPDARDELVQSMTALNRDAAHIMQEIGVHAATDITGFGLLGHLLEMMIGSGTSAEIVLDQIPWLPGAMEMVELDIVPGGTRDNAAYTSPFVEYSVEISLPQKLLLNDAQTSGGLLMAVPANRTARMIDALQNRSVAAVLIGSVTSAENIRIEVI